MSRNAKMRPATAPSGSRITASVNDSQTSSPPARDRDRAAARRRLGLRDSSCALQHLNGRAADRLLLRARRVISSAAEFQRTTRPSRSTATMPSAMFARIATLRSFSSATR